MFADTLKKQAANRTFDVALPLRVGSQLRGDLATRVFADGGVLLPHKALLDLVSPLLNTTAQASLQSVSTDIDGFVSLQTLQQAGFNILYEQQNLEIILKLTADQSLEKDMSMAKKSQPGKEISKVEGLSGFVNFYSSMEMNHESQATQQSDRVMKSLIDGGLFFKGIVVEGEGRFDDTLGLQRTSTRIVYDVPEQQMRYKFGDVNLEGSNLLNSGNVLGFALINDKHLFGTTPPKSYLGSHQFRLTHPSRVKVLVNGVQIQELNLDTGDYDIKDLGLAAGFNAVELIFEDATGRRESAKFNMFISNQQLANDETEFNLAGGFSSNSGRKGLEYNFDQYILSGHIRYGVSDNLTLGLMAQQSYQGSLLGVSTTLGSALGVFNIDVAASKYHNANAVGIGLDVGYILDRFKLFTTDETMRNLHFNFGLRSAAFAADTMSEARWFVRSGYSQDLGEFSKLGLFTSYNKTGNATEWSLDLALSTTFSQNISVSLSGGYKQNDDSTGLFGLLSVSLALENNHRLSSSYDTKTQQSNINYTHTAPNEIGGLGYGLNATNSPSTRSVTGSMRYQANRFDLQIDHNLSKDATKNKINRTTIFSNSSIVFADGKLAFARPVHDGFVILDQHDSIEDKRLIVDPAMGATQYESDWFGPAVVNDLSAYARRDIAVDVEDLPINYDLGAGGFSLMPPYKAGYRLKVGRGYTITLVTIALDQEGKPVALQSGTAALQDHNNAEPVLVFTNRKGRLTAQGLSVGRWTISLGSGAKELRYTVDIPSDATGIFKLNAINPNNVESDTHE